MEIAYGRRPPDILDIENMNPGQLTQEPSPETVTDFKLQQIAIKAHLEARQSADLRRDIAAQLRPSSGPLVNGQRVWYYEQDPNTTKAGAWLRGKITGFNESGSLAVVALSN